MKKLKEISGFLAVSVAATTLDFALYALLLLWGVHYAIAVILGYSTGFALHFYLSRRFVFRQGVKAATFQAELVRTSAVTAGGLGVNLLVLYLLHHLGGADPYLSRIAALILAFIWNYVGRKRFVYH